MDEIFGIPMNSIMIVLLVLLALCLLVVAWVAIRQPVIFKMGIRNIPRRKAQTILIIIGLMLSTMIIAAALGTGDTIDYSATAATYDSLGETDEFLVYSKADDDEANVDRSLDQHLPESVVPELEQHFADLGLVDGIMPALIESVPAILVDENLQPIQAEPTTFIVGIDPAKVDDFGGLATTDGEPIDFANLPAQSVVISETLADDLGAKVGDTIAIYYNNQPLPLTVYAVAEDSPLSGRFDQTTPGMSVPLDRMQEFTGLQGQISLVAISNTGDMRTGMELTDQVTAEIETLYAGQPYGVDPIKQRSIELADLFASLFTTFFLVFGLFSIAVGILLIILIFAMLAAERRSEMGMTRAVGGQRRQLIQQFISEGTAYAVMAGGVGAVLGALAAFAIAYAVKPLLGDFLTIEPHVTPRSMIVAYCLGVIITFIAVVVSSWRISRLNIVAAVRDIPDVSNPTRKLRTLILGAVWLILGGLATISGLNSDSAFMAYFGMSLIPFGIAMILRYLGVPSRPVYTVVGLYLVVLWLLPEGTANSLFGPLDGNIEMFFLSGIFMVAGATILIVQNLDVLLAGVTALGGLFRSALPAVRTAVAFPSASVGRTGLTIAMFSLIVFSLVMFATLNRNFTDLFTGDEANAGWDIRADSSGSNPIGTTDEFLALAASQGVDTSQVAAAGSVNASFQVNMRRDPAQDWKLYPLVGMDEQFITNSQVSFQQHATGYVDDAAIIQALLTEPDSVVISQDALANQGGFGSDPNAFTLEDPDGDGPQQALNSDMPVFDPISIQIEATDGSIKTVRLIGVIDSKVSTLIGMYGNEALVATISPDPQVTSYFLRLTNPEVADEAAKALEAAMITSGVQGTSIKDELEEAQQQSTGFLYIFQGFMGLGLIVGIAAVGVIAFRSVVERRQQIGVLRAIGFQKDMVSLSFLIETAFVVGLGVLSGSTLGILLARNLFASDELGVSDVDFVIPWAIIIAILIVTVLAALLMTIVPARQASNLSPAEALRYE